VNAASTTTTITADTPDPSTAGVAYTVNFTVTVNAPGAGTPTGNVTVSDGTGASCVGTRAAGTCQLTSATPGAKTLVATYAGDGNFASSVSAGVPHQVNAAGTTVTITSDTPDPSVVGQAYTVNFTVAGGATTPTGTVTVSEGTQTCGPVNLVAGAGSCSLTSITAGNKSLVATYSGDATHTGGSSAGVAHQVNMAATTATVTSDLPDPSVVGQPIVVNYSVVVNAPGSGTPTGNVTVSDGIASCVGSVAAGTCNLIPTTAGAKAITASYAGDANFAADGSPGVAHTVNIANTTTTINSDLPDPSTVNAAYTVTYSVAVTAPGAGTPTGNVIVSDGTGPTCIASVAAGQCNITSTSAGAKTLTATYVGDANFNTSTSAGVAHQVNTGGTVTTITSDNPDPSVVGQQVTVNFTVTGAPGTPTGSVNVSDGTISCNGNLTSGAGSCVLTFASAGPRTLTATYSGDATHDASVSAGESHTVNTALTSTSITGDSPDPSTAGSAYAVNFAVAVQAPGTGIPTGNVTVSDGTGNSCVGTVAAGTCNLTSMTAGTKSLTATYATDGNFAASSSAGAGHQVNAGGTVTTITSDNPDPSVVGQQVTVNFTVSGAPGTPTGSVTVSDGTINCNGALTAGAGSCNLTFNTAGPRTLTATYGGDANHNGSTSANQAHGVNTATTTTTITGDTPDPSQVNVAYAVTYTVVANAPGAGTPTGNVTVSDGTGASCVGTVAAGTCNLTSTTPGNKTLTATYATDGNFGGSTSAGVGHTVSSVPTTTTVASSVNPSTFGQAVNFTATVTSGAGTPTGSVQFVVDGSNFGTAVALTGGQATSANTSSLTAGNHTVSANYTATGNFGNSNGALSGGQNVNQAATSTAVASSSDPSVFGQSVTFTATVSSGGGTPTGQVQFVVDGSNFGGAVTLAGGQATSGATSILAVGDHTVVANYLGTTNFQTSNGSIGGGGQSVNQANTTTTITLINPSPSTVGNPITVDFTVTTNAPGGGTPTGNVTVGDGTNSCTETVAVGSCTFTPATAVPATIQVTAVYDGSASHAGSTSAAVNHDVN
jgi:hypothetical protein